MIKGAINSTKVKTRGIIRFFLPVKRFFIPHGKTAGRVACRKSAQPKKNGSWPALLRWNTERPATLREHGGASVLVGNNVKQIRKEYLDTMKLKRTPQRPELWDGKTLFSSSSTFVAVRPLTTTKPYSSYSGKIRFEVEEEKPYNQEFVSRVLSAKEEIKQGKGIKIATEDLWK